MTSSGERRLVDVVRSNPDIAEILGRAPSLGLPGWYLTAGGLFQTVWNRQAGLDPRRAIRDYDLFYFDDSDLSYDAENEVIMAVSALFVDLEIEVEVRNQARVHLWYEEHFGAPIAPYRSTEDAIDHFVATTCCVGITAGSAGNDIVYAPYGVDDVFACVVRPNPRLPMRHVYEVKTARWLEQWPNLTVLPWPDAGQRSSKDLLPSTRRTSTSITTRVGFSRGSR